MKDFSVTIEGLEIRGQRMLHVTINGTTLLFVNQMRKRLFSGMSKEDFLKITKEAGIERYITLSEEQLAIVNAEMARLTMQGHIVATRCTFLPVPEALAIVKYFYENRPLLIQGKNEISCKEDPYALKGCESSDAEVENANKNCQNTVTNAGTLSTKTINSPFESYKEHKIIVGPEEISHTDAKDEKYSSQYADSKQKTCKPCICVLSDIGNDQRKLCKNNGIGQSEVIQTNLFEQEKENKIEKIKKSLKSSISPHILQDDTVMDTSKIDLPVVANEKLFSGEEEKEEEKNKKENSKKERITEEDERPKVKESSKSKISPCKSLDVIDKNCSENKGATVEKKRSEEKGKLPKKANKRKSDDETELKPICDKGKQNKRKSTNSLDFPIVKQKRFDSNAKGSEEDDIPLIQLRDDHLPKDAEARVPCSSLCSVESKKLSEVVDVFDVNHTGDLQKPIKPDAFNNGTPKSAIPGHVTKETESGITPASNYIKDDMNTDEIMKILPRLNKNREKAKSKEKGNTPASGRKKDTTCSMKERQKTPRFRLRVEPEIGTFIADTFPTGLIIIGNTKSVRYIEVDNIRYVYKTDVYSNLLTPVTPNSLYSKANFTCLCKSLQIKKRDLSQTNPREFVQMPKDLQKVSRSLLAERDVRKLYGKFLTYQEKRKSVFLPTKSVKTPQAVICDRSPNSCKSKVNEDKYTATDGNIRSAPQLPADRSMEQSIIQLHGENVLENIDSSVGHLRAAASDVLGCSVVELEIPQISKKTSTQQDFNEYKKRQENLTAELRAIILEQKRSLCLAKTECDTANERMHTVIEELDDVKKQLSEVTAERDQARAEHYFSKKKVSNTDVANAFQKQFEIFMNLNLSINDKLDKLRSDFNKERIETDSFCQKVDEFAARLSRNADSNLQGLSSSLPFE